MFRDGGKQCRGACSEVLPEEIKEAVPGLVRDGGVVRVERLVEADRLFVWLSRSGTSVGHVVFTSSGALNSPRASTAAGSAARQRSSLAFMMTCDRVDRSRSRRRKGRWLCDEARRGTRRRRGARLDGIETCSGHHARRARGLLKNDDTVIVDC